MKSRLLDSAGFVAAALRPLGLLLASHGDEPRARLLPSAGDVSLSTQ